MEAFQGQEVRGSSKRFKINVEQSKDKSETLYAEKSPEIKQVNQQLLYRIGGHQHSGVSVLKLRH